MWERLSFTGWGVEPLSCSLAKNKLCEGEGRKKERGGEKRSELKCWVWPAASWSLLFAAVRLFTAAFTLQRLKMRIWSTVSSPHVLRILPGVSFFPPCTLKTCCCVWSFSSLTTNHIDFQLHAVLGYLVYLVFLPLQTLVCSCGTDVWHRRTGKMEENGMYVGWN